MAFFFELNSQQEKVFLHLTVHTVHLFIFLFNIIMIDVDQLVKSEQSTLHLSASPACFRRPSRQYDGDEGEVKSFLVKTVHTIHCMFLLFIFKVLAREYSVNSEHFTVHLRRL
jgi:hypothetical protein